MATESIPGTPTTVTAPVAPAPVIDFTGQPYLYPQEDGSLGGVGSTKPETIPGTPEYQVTSTNDLRQANDYVFTSLNNRKAYTSFESAENLAVFGTARAPDKVEDRDAAAWKIIKHDRPASTHNAGLVYDRIVKFASQKKQLDIKNGEAFPSVYGLNNDDELIQFVTDPKNNIPPSVAKELIRETTDKTYFSERRRFGVDLKSKIQKSLLGLDDRYVAGEIVAKQGKPYFDGLTRQAKIAAWKDYAYYKDNQRDVNFINDAASAGMNFIEDGFVAIGGAIDGMLATAPDEYLSEAYRIDPAKKAKADEIVKRSTVVLKPVIDAISKSRASGNGRLTMSLLDEYTNFDDAANQEVIKALSEMAALRADGAFQPGKRFEKLASFGAGVIESVPTFKHFINDSLDPGSILFLNETMQNAAFSDSVPGLAKAILAPKAVVTAAGSAVLAKFQNNTRYWSEASDQEVLNAVEQYGENWQNVNTKTGNAVSVAFDAIGLKAAAYAAKTAYGDVRLQEAATATFDPITLALGGTTLVMKMAGRSGMGAIKFAEISTRGKALTAEGEVLAAEVKAAALPLVGEQTLVETLIDSFKTATGRTLTEAEALAIAMSGTADDILGKSGQVARDGINKYLADPKFADLAKRVRDFQARAAAHAKDLAGLDTATRPISGRFINYAGFGTEKLGTGVRRMGEWMGGGNSERALGKWGLRWILQNQNLPYVQGAIGGLAAGSYTAATGGEFWTGGLGGLVGAGVLLRPQAMMTAGAGLETYGKVIGRLGKAAIGGEYISSTPLNKVANGIRTELSAMPNTAENVARRASLEGQLRMTEWMVESGWEAAARSGFRVMVNDVIQGGSTGAGFAWANDRQSAGTGFGVGAAFGMVTRSAVAIGADFKEVSGLKSIASEESVRGKQVWSDVIAIDRGLDAHQSARLRTWLEGGKTWAEQTERADSYRRAYIATNGRIQLTNPSEMAAMSLTTHLSPEQVAKIREEANATHPDDPTAAALFAEQKLAEMDSRKQSKVNLDALTRDLADSDRRIDASNGNINRTNEKINTERLNLKRNGLTESKVLVQLLHELETQTTNHNVTMAENLQLRAEHSEAARQVENPLTFRKFEERTSANGSGTIRQVKEGVYIDQGQNSHTIYFDTTKGDPFTMFHETWEALLHDDAVRPMAKEMTTILWGGEGKGQRISDQARDYFFTVYSNHLAAPEKAAFDAQLAAAKKHFTDTGSTSMLDRYTRETLAWWMATIDAQGRPSAYAGGKETPAVNVGVRGKGVIDSLMRLTRGDRRLMDILQNDNIRAEIAGLIDPEIGVIPRKYAANMVQQLQSSGMRFIAQQDGTVRGFWTNNRNEVVRDPVVVKMYESILRMTSGGKGSPRLADLSVTQLTHQQQANLFLASGLTWLVDPGTGTPIPGLNPPGPTAAPTPAPAPVPVPAGATPAPVPGGPNPTPIPVIPTRNGQPIPAPTATPTPGQPIPPPAPAPVPTPTGRPTTPPAPTTPTAPRPAPPIAPVPAAPTAPKPPVNPSQMPHLHQVTSQHADVIVRALQGVAEADRGFQWSVDTGAKGKPTIMWGKPTRAEIAAIDGLRGQLPDTIVDNLVQVFNSLALAGSERPVFQARVVRAETHRPSTTSERRVQIGDEFQYIADETFVPLHLETTIQYVGPDGVKSAAEYAKLGNLEKGLYTPTNSFTMKVFNLGKLNQNLSTARSEGLRIYDKDGNVTGYVKDLAGNEITAKQFAELFRDDTEFNTLANQWLQRYLDGGPIDPTSIEVPGGKITEPSAISLGNGDMALGEARLTALRAVFGLTTRNGRVVVNPTNFTNQVTRGFNFPFQSIKVSHMGTMVDTGARSLMAQPAVTRGQFNMSPGAWDKLSGDRVAKLRTGFLAVNPANTLTGSWSHPELPNSYIHEFNGRSYDIYVEGQNVPNTAKNFDQAVAQSNQVRLQAEAGLEASRFADKVLKAEAKKLADAQAKDAATQAAEQKKIERSRTKAEADLLKDVRKGNSEWYDASEAISNREAQIIKEHEAAKAKSDADYQAAVEKNKAEVERLQNERTRINEKLKQDIIQRSAEKIREAEKANVERTAAVDRESAQRSKDLREDIERRSAETAAKDAKDKAKIAVEDANALADALNSKDPELDLAKIINASVRVDPKGLRVTAVDRPLIVRRIGGGKPFVPRSATTGTQAGPAVGATIGNTQAAGILGSPEVAKQVPNVNKYFDRHMGLSVDLQSAINSVWKTELGNQLVAYYNGVNKQGKAVYTYHLYGIDGTEMYRTQDSRAAYNALQMNEERIRNPMKNVPGTVSKEKATAELYKAVGGKTIINQYSTPVEREKMERAAKRYK